MVVHDTGPDRYADVVVYLGTGTYQTRVPITSSGMINLPTLPAGCGMAHVSVSYRARTSKVCPPSEKLTPVGQKKRNAENLRKALADIPSNRRKLRW